MDYPANLPATRSSWLVIIASTPSLVFSILRSGTMSFTTQPDWDEQYRIGETPWDKGEAAPPLVAWLHGNPGSMTGTVLVPGCGTGHDVRAIATAETEATPIGLDLSATAIAACQQHLPIGSEQYCVGDLYALPEALRGTCDWVWEHTCFCAIDPTRRDDYVTAVAMALKPGGQLLGIFYLDPYRGDHQPGSGPPHGCTIEELHDRFTGGGKFTIDAITTPKACYPERLGRERLVAMSTSVVRKTPMIPHT